MQMFVDRKDSLRRDYNIRDNGIEVSLKKQRPQLALPMPAFGEVLCKVRDKCKDDFETVLDEMNRLIDNGTVIPCYLKNAVDTFRIAKDLSAVMDDDRDQISPMDALIVASAVTNPNCTILYTTDSQLLSISLPDSAVDWRADNGCKSLAVRSILDIIKAR